ncbi:MAG: hydantoinase B/oxoprolinase family protein [Alphaproteobacteria bacterium]|nr:hydantoinase B/oxoprolinase family protein [Alphaproteobacteria bacterium]
MAQTKPATRLGSTPIDPVTASVIQGALESIAVEMGYKLMRMSYSSIIRESEDFGAALVDVRIRQLCESRQSTPLQSGPIPGYVKGMNGLLAERGQTLNPGDVVMHNSAYHGASHGPDVAFVVPVFFKGRLVGYSVTTAHHLDIGASSPGSCGIVDSLDAYAEGLQFKALKVYDKGVLNVPLWHMVRDNIRASDLVVGDMEAQIAAARIGADRFLELIERYGLNTVEAAGDALMDHSERLMRQTIEALPDGTYSALGHVDGFEDDPERRDLKIKVTVTIKGSDITVDLTGTDKQIDDRPLNMPLEGTVDCAIWLTVRSILLDSFVHGHIPQNSGLVRPITIIAPKGTLVNPNFPAPTIARFCPGNIVADTLMRALSEAVPRQVSAGVGNLKVIAYSGIHGGAHWVHMDIHEGSYGGRYGKDGMDTVDTLYANTRNNPIEDIESHLPLRVLRYELRDGEAAPGQWRGGIGSLREVELLEDGSFSIEGDGHMFAPWGFKGGADGHTSKLLFRPKSGGEMSLPSMMPNKPTKAGDRLVLVGTCGGGYGDPLMRAPALVLSDVLDGFVTLTSAKDDYGVSITPDKTIDQAATTALRRARGAPSP